MDEFYLFILFGTLQNPISDEGEYRQYVTDLVDLIDRADCEKGVELYYQESNRQSIIDDLNTNAEMEDFYMINAETVINDALRYAMDWENDSIYESQNACIYHYWNGGTTEEALPQLKEMTEYSLQKEGKTLLLNINNAFDASGRKYIPILKDCHQNLEYEPQLILIAHVSNFLALDYWFEENRRQRNFNRDDNRHVKSHPDYRQGKSPLLCHKDKAQELLNTAITDQRASEHASKDLMNFDEECDMYVWFEYENDNPQNQYHGYHLADCDSDERDIDAEDEIPDRVKRLLEIRRKLME